MSAKVKRYYIDELGVKYEDTPQGWNPGDPRQKEWSKARKEIGFDERETWDLKYTVDLFLYERLCDYKNIAQGCIDLEFHTFEYENKKITQKECLDRMINGLKLEITLGPFDERREDPEIIKQIEDIYPIYNLCKESLWW